MSDTIEKGTLVSFYFSMFTMEGDCLGGTENQEPLQYIHGETPIDPPGLEEYLDGKTAGHSGSVTLPPEKAYGQRLLPPEESIDQIPLEQFPMDEIVPGMMFVANIEGKGDLPITIMDIQGDVAMVHYGHPLAGQTLRFEVEIQTISKATDDERRLFGLIQ